MSEVKKLEDIASQVRRDIVRMVAGAKSGHPGGSLGSTDYLVALYFDIMNHNASSFSMDAKGEDLFFLSNGHISPVFYSVLSRAGYFPIEELKSFRKINSRLQGHPTTAEHLEGVRIASGSLGQGLSNAIGSALTKKLNDDSSIVYSLHGDGELQEGQIWEAVMYASGKNVDNLIAAIDYNQKQIDGSIDDVLPLGDLKAKFEAFDWIVLECNGNNMQEILDTNAKAKSLLGNGKPVMILLHTEMGQGVDFMMGTHKWHGIFPNDEELASALSQLEETLGDY